AYKTQNKAHRSDFSSNGVHQNHSRQFKSPEQVEEELKKRNEESVARAQKQAEEFLKQKGIESRLESKLPSGKPTTVGGGEKAEVAQIVVTDKPDERVMVAVTAEAVAKAIVG
ncbi:MAG: hypothetical protein ACKO96_06710, partial [Flammeovirgaceae bacterium]